MKGIINCRLLLMSSVDRSLTPRADVSDFTLISQHKKKKPMSC